MGEGALGGLVGGGRGRAGGTCVDEGRLTFDAGFQAGFGDLHVEVFAFVI